MIFKIICDFHLSIPFLKQFREKQIKEIVLEIADLEDEVQDIASKITCDSVF